MKFLKNIFYCYLYILIPSIIYVYGDDLSSEDNYTDFLLCMKDDYSGNFSIPVSMNLKIEKEILDEANAGTFLQMHLEQFEKNLPGDVSSNIEGNIDNLSCMTGDNERNYGNLSIPDSMNFKTGDEALDERNVAAILQKHFDELEKEYKDDSPDSSTEQSISTDITDIYANIERNYTDILSCMKYDNEWYYGGNLRIPVSMNLKTEEEALDEANFAAILQMHLDESEKEYKNLPDSLNGKIISTDIACHLYQPYALDVEGRFRYLFSTRMPAAWFMNYLYYKSLVKLVIAKRNQKIIGEHNSGKTLLVENASIKNGKKQKKEAKPTVVFLAGGDGSGKTSAVQRLNLPVIENADIIRDATMGSDAEFHRNVIEKTLKLGLNVAIVYVFRPIEQALDANIIRAEQIGRVRPLIEIVDAHYRAQQNVLEFHEFFGDRIKVLVVDNSRTFEEISLVDDVMGFLRSPEVYYKSRNEVLERALCAYGNKNKQEIPEIIRNLLESKLSSSDFKNSTDTELEKERWFNYLTKFIINVATKMGF